jgi:hypothetical protein
VTVLFLILYDLVAYVFGGNEATISRIVLEAGGGNLTGFSLGAAFVVGTLFGHFFWPQTKDGPRRS